MNSWQKLATNCKLVAIEMAWFQVEIDVMLILLGDGDFETSSRVLGVHPKQRKPKPVLYFKDDPSLQEEPGKLCEDSGFWKVFTRAARSQTV